MTNYLIDENNSIDVAAGIGLTLAAGDTVNVTAGGSIKNSSGTSIYSQQGETRIQIDGLVFSALGTGIRADAGNTYTIIGETGTVSGRSFGLNFVSGTHIITIRAEST